MTAAFGQPVDKGMAPIALTGRTWTVLFSALIGGVALIGWWAIATDLPLGVPGEWCWGRMVLGADANLLAFGWPMSFALLLAIWVARIASPRRALFVCKRAAAIAVTAGLVVAFQLSLEAAAPLGLAKWAFVPYREHISGSYSAASKVAGGAREAVTEFTRFADQHRWTHIQANPPGMIVMYRGVLTFFDGLPGVARIVDGFQPAAMRREFNRIAAREGRPIPVADRAAILSVVVASRWFAMMAIAPVAWLAAMRARDEATRLNEGQPSADAGEVALLGVAASGLVPAAILFAPRQDSFFPTISAIIFALTHAAVSRKSLAKAAMAGVLLWVGMFISLAFAVVGLMAGLVVAQECFMERGKAIPFFRLWGAAIGGWFVGPLMIYAAWDANVFEIWDFNLAKNDEFYQLSPRTFHLWVWVNLVEFAVAIGLPVAVLASIKAIGEVKRFVASKHYDVLAISWLAVLGLLNFTGISQSEVARLWLPFAPFAALFAAETMVRFNPAARRWCAAGFILLQASTCIMLARHVCVME